MIDRDLTTIANGHHPKGDAPAAESSDGESPPRKLKSSAIGSGSARRGNVRKRTALLGGGRNTVGFVAIGYLVLLLAVAVVYSVRPGLVPPAFGPVAPGVPWFGAVGASLLSLKAVFDHHGRGWSDDHAFWHWSRPFVGAIAAVVSALIFQAGILAVGTEPTANAASIAATSTPLYHVMAFLVGYREDTFRALLKRLGDVILAPGDTEGKKPDPADARHPRNAQRGTVAR